ncbi:hypothetical protein OGAPHI_000677 [Ogataea philodendri]|uniref:Uncharacterized protein n=1 Tax=Ogataea philodendri TaxID=1378263 RepID=A0A9P8T9K4_9ASCO|nr:uncharacterized protein OGAPHI_000677 [Ogataea philodendri]KAH3670966.1 hypothetical protein OGAPHI_000677 [Ogataea philodendri]
MSPYPNILKVYKQYDPIWVIGLGIIGVLVISASMRELNYPRDFVGKMGSSQLLSTFINCSASYKSSHCLKRYKKDILQDFASVLMPAVHAELELCLSALSPSETDAGVLMGVQSCLLRSEKLNSAFRSSNSIPSKPSSQYSKGYLFFSISSVLVSWWISWKSSSSNAQQPTETANAKLELVSNDVSVLKEKIFGLEKSVCNLELLANSYSQKEKELTSKLEFLQREYNSFRKVSGVTVDPRFPLDSGNIGEFSRDHKLQRDKSIKVGDQTFNIATKDGLDKWKTFVHQSIGKKPEIEPKSQTAENETPSPQIDLKNLKTTDENGKPFRRIFVPNRGWVSSRKLQHELQLLS